jgi:hypothetical protein
MPNEALISKIENMLAEIVALGGQNERTSIVPNLTVQDANPAGFSDFVIISDDRDGDNILAKKVGSVIYADNDLVNVMFIEGAEAIAFQQGSQSSNNGIWEIVPSTTTDIFYDKGKVGIGTNTIPKGGVGSALLALEGPNYDDADGPHIQITTDEDDYPVMQHLFQGHDEVVIHFDAYTDATGTDRSSAAFNNFQIQKSNGNFRIRYDSAVAAGGAISWLEGLTVDGTTGNVGIGTTSPTPKLESVSSTLAQLRLTHTFGSKFVDFTVGTNHDLTVKPSSTGQIILQPTTDQTNFFQVLDADGGTPVLNVDSTNERVGVGIAAPAQKFHVSDSVSVIARFATTSSTAFAGFQNVADTATTLNSQLFGSAFAGTQFSNARADTASLFSDGAAANLFTLGTKSAHDLVIGTQNVERMRITDTAAGGLVRIGPVATTPAAKLHVDQDSTTAAIPVAYFDQADISEEMFQLNTTIGVGNAIEAVGAKTLTTTHFVKVTLPGALTRYFPVGTIA